MKVICEGKIPESKKYRGQCVYCGCMIEIDDFDVDYNGNSYSFECPTEGCPEFIKCSTDPKLFANL